MQKYQHINLFTLELGKALCEIIAHKYKYDSCRVIKEILQSLIKEKSVFEMLYKSLKQLQMKK